MINAGGRLELIMNKKKQIAGSVVIVLVVMLFTFLPACAPQPAGPIPETEPISYTDASVGYLGPEGTYTQEACRVFFDREGEYIPYPAVSDAVEALVEGSVDYAVIPQENTIGGAVIDYVDTFLGSFPVR